tara:strand:+ start:479 stop:1504 length:1026 start_codon:yes stop_codon:yes gene_type:complete
MSNAHLIWSQRFLKHVPPVGHPEQVARASVMQKVAEGWISDGGSASEPNQGAAEHILRVHSRQHFENIEKTAGSNFRFDQDTYASPESSLVAKLAVGASIDAVDYALSGKPAVAFVRPPGHHAEQDRAMGFCFYNNIAIAASYALSSGRKKIAIVDYDVHHGNGTQWMFYDDPRVLYISIHQYPFYPGTGAADDVGRNDGAGFTVNIPLAAGAGDADYMLLLNRLVIPILRQFNPDLLLLSSGYDAHVDDPLGGMNLSTRGFAEIMRKLREVSDECCEGRIITVTEGGYNLGVLEECLAVTLEIMAGVTFDSFEGNRKAEELAETSLDKVLSAQSSFWPGL